MFAMTIVFGPSVPWTLMFKTAEAMSRAREAVNNPQLFGDMDHLLVADDYGQEIAVRRSAIQGIMFEDMSQSKMAQIERGLHQTRTQIEANNMGRADPAISAAMRSAGQGPGVITPFGPNGAFRQ